MELPAPGQNDEGIYRPLGEINVTPLVDVMLVLLIIFMVTAPMLATGMKVDLPKTSAALPLDPQHPILVSIGHDGRLEVDDQDVAPDGLVAAVRQKMNGDFGRTVQLRGDRDAAYGAVVGIMDRLAAAGISHLAIVTEAQAEGLSPAAAPPGRAP